MTSITKNEVQLALKKDDFKTYKDIYFRATGKDYKGKCNSCGKKFLRKWCDIYLKNNFN